MKIIRGPSEIYKGPYIYMYIVVTLRSQYHNTISDCYLISIGIQNLISFIEFIFQGERTVYNCIGITQTLFATCIKYFSVDLKGGILDISIETGNVILPNGRGMLNNTYNVLCLFPCVTQRIIIVLLIHQCFDIIGSYVM